LTSIEHNDQWYKIIKDKLIAEGVTNVDLIHASLEGDGESPYVRAISRFKDASFDFVLVDGRIRDFCILAAIPKIRPGGMLIVDNINEYIPNEQGLSFSPLSATYAADHWGETQAALRKHRFIWTTNGVWDTAVYFLGSN
jgi:hypothetical protein